MFAWLKTFWTYIGKVNSERPGEPSYLRTVGFYLCILLGAAITFGTVWTVLFYKDLWVIVLGMDISFILVVLGIKKMAKKDEIEAEKETASAKLEEKKVDNALEIKKIELAPPVQQ